MTMNVPIETLVFILPPFVALWLTMFSRTATSVAALLVIMFALTWTGE